MKLGSHINFLGTIGTASILLWGLSQSHAKPEYAPASVQAETLPQPARKTAIHVVPKPRRVLATTAPHLDDAIAITNTGSLPKYAAVEPMEPLYQPASTESDNDPASRIDSGPARPARGDANAAQRTEINISHRLTADVTIKNLCKLHPYTAVASTAPIYQLASKETGDGARDPAEVQVTPAVQNIMNKARPKQLTGTMTVEGKEYAFGSGGHGQSIPYGDYLITPDAIGSWGSRHGAIGVANGSIPDPKLHRDRDGIELHAATNDKLETDGCVSIKKDQWPEFRKQVLGMVKDNKKVYLHVSDQGASVSTVPLEFIGETISEPTFRDALNMIENEPAKVESDRPAIRHSARSRFRGERHASLSCGHECRRRHAGHARL